LEKDLYCPSSLKQQSTDRYVAPLGDIILISSQSVFALPPYAACLATNTNLIVFDLIRSGIEPTIYRIRGEHANHYTTDAVQITIVIVFGLNQSGLEPCHN
jgi:hypothetical protein